MDNDSGDKGFDKLLCVRSDESDKSSQGRVTGDGNMVDDL